MSSHLPSPSFHARSDDAPRLVRHVSRPVWGRGVLVRNAPTRRAYQFEDGRTRTFKKGFYHLLEEVPEDDPSTRRLAERLEARAEDRAEVRQALATASGATSPSRADTKERLQKQVQWFLKNNPDAFEGDDWKTRHRGEDGRRLKRHRDPVVAEAQAFFSEENMKQMIDEADPDLVRDGFMKILESSDLVTAARRRPLKTARLDMEWVEALNDLMHGERAFALRFERWVAACDRVADKMATWPLCTVPLALARPDEHIFVRPTRMKTQLGWMAPGRPLPRRPGAPTYQVLVDVFNEITKELEAAGHAPVDRLDVHDFIMETTTSKAKEALE